jgi:hypothetical protein
LGVGVLHQRDTLPSSGSAQQQQVFLETGAALGLFAHIHTMGLQPQRPVSAVGILQQWVVEAIQRVFDRPPVGKQRRACDR